MSGKAIIFAEEARAKTLKGVKSLPASRKAALKIVLD